MNIYLSGLFGTKLSIVKSRSATSESAIFEIFQYFKNFCPLYFDDEFTKELCRVTIPIKFCFYIAKIIDLNDGNTM